MFKDKLYVGQGAVTWFLIVGLNFCCDVKTRPLLRVKMKAIGLEMLD